MKKIMMSMLVMIFCISIPVSTFSQDVEGVEDDFHIIIDATDTSEQIYEINGI